MGPGSAPSGGQSGGHGLVHDPEDGVQPGQHVGLVRAGDGRLVLQDQPVQGQPALGQAQAQLAHAGVGMDRRPARRRRLAPDLDEPAAGRGVLAREQRSPVPAEQSDGQGVGAGEVVHDAVIEHVVRADLQPRRAQIHDAPGAGIGADLLQERRRAGLERAAQQAGQHGARGAVAAPRGREAAEQPDLHPRGPGQNIRRQRPRGPEEVAGGAHGADGVGAGRAGADLEQVENAQVDDGHGASGGSRFRLAGAGRSEATLPAARKLAKPRAGRLRDCDRPS